MVLKTCCGTASSFCCCCVSPCVVVVCSCLLSTHLLLIGAIGAVSRVVIPPGTSGTKDQMVAPPSVVGAKVEVMPEVSRSLLRDSGSSDHQSGRQASRPSL